MTATLPYLVTPGSIKNALERIKTAATPDRVTGDFVGTKLQIKGGTGTAVLSFLKKIGFVASDGSPTDIYRRFRNNVTAGRAAADAIIHGYIELHKANEYFYDLNDKDLLGLIVQVTGAESDSTVAKYTLSTLKNLKAFADFSTDEPNVEPTPSHDVGGHLPNFAPVHERSEGRLGMNLSYTINLNLPATSDQAVFNAIFKSLKEYLIDQNE